MLSKPTPRGKPHADFLHQSGNGVLSIAVSFEPEGATPAPLQNLTDDGDVSFPSLYCFQPLRDDRWDAFVEQHPSSSVFHTSAWLEALYRTYGYQSFAYTTCPPSNNLKDAILFCRVESWLTGRRLVSLPFSDHCEPLLDSELASTVLEESISRELQQNHWQYVELRPIRPILVEGQFSSSNIVYAFHELDLTPGLDVIFGNFHKSSIQRKIQRAERERLRYCEGSDDALLDDFYSLLELTRRRHKLPPQPRKWFDNLIKCFGSALKVRVAYNDRRPLAAMLTIRHRETLVYKYGASDSRFNNLGGMHLLFWRAIQEAKMSGLRCLDFGRSDPGQDGLIRFKNRWGAAQSLLAYSRYSLSKPSTHILDLYASERKTAAAKFLLSRLPAGFQSIIGKIIYRHVG